MQGRPQACRRVCGYSFAHVLAHASRTPNRGPAETTYRSKEILMTKLVLALALAFATLATVPASAGPYCQEDLGYGRTGSFGCGGLVTSPGAPGASRDWGAFAGLMGGG